MFFTEAILVYNQLGLGISSASKKSQFTCHGLFTQFQEEDVGGGPAPVVCCCLCRCSDHVPGCWVPVWLPMGSVGVSSRLLAPKLNWALMGIPPS